MLLENTPGFEKNTSCSADREATRSLSMESRSGQNSGGEERRSNQDMKSQSDQQGIQSPLGSYDVNEDIEDANDTSSKDDDEKPSANQPWTSFIETRILTHPKSATSDQRDETLQQMAQAVKSMQKQMFHLSTRMIAPSGFVKSEHPSNIYVKAERTSSEAPIDLVNSSEDEYQSSGSGSETSRLPEKRSSATTRDKKRKEYRRGDEEVRGRKRNPKTKRRTPSYTRGKQRRDCSFRNWEKGINRRAKVEQINEEIADSTAENLPEILAHMRVSGFAIIPNFKKLTQKPKFPMRIGSSDDEEGASTTRITSVFQEGNEPDAAQAEFAHTAGWNANGSAKTPKHDLLFEGVVINSKDYEFKTRISKQEPHDVSGRLPRQAMRQKSKALEAYNEKYIGQMRDIIKGMFANEKQKPGYEPANPDNWHMSQNIVWGGTGHQHPHCDQGKAGCFNTEQIFPFVCIHGFGLHEFAMWIMPASKRREYGFPFRFPKNAMLFMRGDLIHAGAYSQLSRAHLEFWPKAAAGWTSSRNPYWFTQESFALWQAKKVVFLLPDLRTYPFAFPEISEEDDNGFQTVTYPVKYTEELFPYLDDNFTSQKVKKGQTSAVQHATLQTYPPADETGRNSRSAPKRVAEKEPRHGPAKKRSRK